MQCSIATSAGRTCISRPINLNAVCARCFSKIKEIERFKREGPRPIVYDPTDADELAGATAAEPSKLPVK